MPHLFTTLLLLGVGLLSACGSDPSVTFTVTALSDTPMPAGIAEKLDAQLKRPVDACFRELREANPEAAGTVTVTGSGSHGVMTLEPEAATAPPALTGGVTALLSTQKVQRALVDGDTITGFRLVVTFAG